MSTSYRIGLGSVVVSIVLAGAFCFGRISTDPDLFRVASDLSENPLEVPEFSLVERSGRVVERSDLDESVWIASFIFTRCPASCPKISAVMAQIQDALDSEAIHLVSISVDPAYDSPEVLTRYAERFEADPERWWFLTGNEEAARGLVTGGFKLPAIETDAEAQAQGAEQISHSGRLALVDVRGQIVGYFDSSDPQQVETLIARAERLAQLAERDPPDWVWSLPAINAGLNGSCTLTLMAGWVLILSRRRRLHAALMIASLTLSAVFLSCYLVYHYYVGSVPFEGTGWIRPIYYTILLSHVVLAAGMLPLIALTVYQAARGRFDVHKKYSRITFPIWIYVSVTGVIVYLLLYQLDVSATSITA